MESTFRATLMASDTGASEMYGFTADSGLFRKPARQIVRAFMKHMKTEGTWKRAPSYRLNSAKKKAGNGVVIAMGSLLLERGELPFVLVISPASVENCNARA